MPREVLEGPQPASPPRLMTFDEYSRVRHIAPYVLDISAAGGRLVYIGSRHTNDPDALDVRLIEEAWGQLRPDLGGGRVGRATATYLEQRDIDYRVVELVPGRVPLELGWLRWWQSRYGPAWL